MSIPSKYECRTVALADIHPEVSPFRITTNDAVGDLADALNRVGLINPPILAYSESGYVVVCGFRRILAARSLAWNTIPARILHNPHDPLICAYLAISENSIERPLNLIETSRALSLLESCIPDTEERYKVAGSLGLPSSPSLVQKIKPLCRLPRSLQDGLLSGKIALSSALMLSKLDSKTADVLLKLLSDLKLSVSNQKELIVTIQEIAILEDVSAERLIQSEEIQEIVNSAEMDTPSKAGLLRSHLKHRRFPHISSAMDSFETMKKRLSLGENVSLKPPPGFEGNHYSIAFSFSSLFELNQHKQTLERLVHDGRIRALFDSGNQTIP